MATRNIVPRATGEGSIGTAAKHWGAGHFDSLPNWQEYLAESTGYGIVSGCTPTISGLTVTVASGVVHLADGTRKVIAATNVTLDAADSTNPRIDIVYIDSTGTVAKVTGTASASPSAPNVPSNGISVCTVSVAANASTGTLITVLAKNELPFVVDNVAELRASNFSVGRTIMTKGYYVENDGGAAIYRIRIANLDVDDGGGIIILDNGNVAELITNGTVNVKQFGAKGDGVTDDTEAIQAAVNASEILTFMPNESYLIKTDTNDTILTDTTDKSYCAIKINAPLHIIGNDALLIETHNLSGSGIDAYAFAVNSENVEIEGLKITGQYDQGLSFGYGIQQNAGKVHIHDCRFRHMGGSPIVCNGTYAGHIDTVKIENCHIHDVGNALFFAWADNVIINNLTCVNCGDGFDFDKESTHVIISNIIARGTRGSASDGFIEIDGGKYFTISNLVIDNAWYGIQVDGKLVQTEGLNYQTISEFITVDGCYINNCDHAIALGNALGSSVQECKNMIFSNILVSNIKYNAFHIRGENIDLVNCVAQHGSQSGNYHSILINDKAKNITIENFTNHCAGLISCSKCDDVLSLVNIIDDNSNNKSNQNLINGVDIVRINGLQITNESLFSAADNRLYYVNCNQIICSDIITNMLSTALFKITTATKRYYSNCRLNDGFTDIITSNVIYNKMAFNDIKNQPFRNGTLLICGTSDATRAAYICISGFVDDGGSTNIWKQITMA